MDRTEKIGCGVMGCGGVAFLVISALVVWMAVVVVQRAERHDGAVDPNGADRGPPAIRACVGRPGPAPAEARVAAADPRHVDLGAIVPQARALALRADGDAELTTVSSPDLSTHGTYDIVAGTIAVNFEFRCLEPGKPPGADRRQGHVLVLLRDGKATTSRLDIPAGLLGTVAPFEGTPCDTRAAWRAVVATGVPDDARATFVLSPPIGEPGSGWVWIVDVPGHPEHRREVSAKTCSHVTQNGRPL